MPVTEGMERELKQATGEAQGKAAEAGGHKGGRGRSRVLQEFDAIVRQYLTEVVEPAEVREPEPPPQPAPSPEAEPPVRWVGLEAQASALRLISERMARKYLALPLEIKGDTLIVAMAVPDNLQAIEDLEAQAHMRIQSVEAQPQEIQRAIDLNYQGLGEIESELGQVTLLQPQTTASAATAAQTPIARAVDLILGQAVRSRASDIHIEPQGGKMRIRYRIDGVLRETMALPAGLHGPLVSRLKILAGMNIAERRRPQDGQLSIQVDGRAVDVRVATCSTVHGELMVLRLLDKGQGLLSLAQVGMQSHDLQHHRKLLKSPFGMLVVCGPTGSGKTTTLYASINELDRERRHIITIEDPVEYRFESINQIQVNAKAGITFATALRAVLRLDPDVILIGEIRDGETAQTAVQAALTGHLVLCSLHANDAASALFRLMDLGVEPALLSSALLGVVAQRMVRRICPRCHSGGASPPEGKKESPEVGAEKGPHGLGPLMRRQGCRLCSYTGYSGRTGVFEVMVLSDALRHMICTPGATSAEVRAQAVAEGMITMRRDGMAKVQAGITTVGEIAANVFSTAPEDSPQ